MAAQNYVMPSQSHALEMTSVAIFSWYIREGERCWGLGSWRVSVQWSCGMCRCGQCRNKWQTGGVTGQVSLRNKVRPLHCTVRSGFRRSGVASAGVESSSVDDSINMLQLSKRNDIKCVADFRWRLYSTLCKDVENYSSRGKNVTCKLW
jgi:hypothetical protein